MLEISFETICTQVYINFQTFHVVNGIFLDVHLVALTLGIRSTNHFFFVQLKITNGSSKAN